MGLLKGLGKIAIGVVQLTNGSIVSDGLMQTCLKCGMPHHGVCTRCAISKGSENLSEGFKEVIQSSSTYQKGQIEAKKEGYIEASNEYENKLRKQADDFLSQRKSFEQQRSEYEQLLNDFEHCIDGLECKTARTEEENRLLLDMLNEERKLRKLSRK